MTTNQKMKRPLSQEFWIGLTVLGCMLGFILGILTTVIVQRTGALRALPTAAADGPPEVSPPIPGNYPPPDKDGFFLAQNQQLIELPGLLDDKAVDFVELPSFNDTSPNFVVRGASFPIGKLKLFVCLAGIGVDLKYGEAGAIVNAVAPDSPAQYAGLLPGELITTINGQSVAQPPGSPPAGGDLLGNMGDELTLQVLSGTSVRTIEVTRSDRAIVTGNSATVQPAIPFEIEPQDGYILIRPTQKLAPGFYAFDFWEPVKNYLLPASVETPRPPLPAEIWMFRVR